MTHSWDWDVTLCLTDDPSVTIPGVTTKHWLSAGRTKCCETSRKPNSSGSLDTVGPWLAPTHTLVGLKWAQSLLSATSGPEKINSTWCLNIFTFRGPYLLVSKYQFCHFSRCKGDESHLLHCPHTALRSCGIAEVAGVTCIKNEGDAAAWSSLSYSLKSNWANSSPVKSHQKATI